jgi:hypothetical protein
MSKTYKIILKAICIVVTVSALLIGLYAFQIKEYRNSFSQIRLGQSKETVINIMGKPSEIRSCSFPIYNGNKHQIGNCIEIIDYKGFYEQWAFAFDINGNVIEKYYWFLGEYGKKPLNTISVDNSQTR